MKSPKDLSGGEWIDVPDYKKIEENLGKELGENKVQKVEEIEMQFIRAED